MRLNIGPAGPAATALRYMLSPVRLSVTRVHGSVKDG